TLSLHDALPIYTAELDGLDSHALVLTQLAKRQGKIGLGSGRAGILTGRQRRVLRPRQGHAHHQQRAEQRNFMERGRDRLRQTLTFSISAARRTSSDGNSPACHAGEDVPPNAVQLWTLLQPGPRGEVNVESL